MKEQDAGLIVTCVKPLYSPGAIEGNHGETIYTTTFELRKFRICWQHHVSQLLLKNCEIIPLDSWIKQCDRLCYAAGWRKNSVFQLRQQYRANLWGRSNTSSIQYLVTGFCIILTFVKHTTLSPSRKRTATSACDVPLLYSQTKRYSRNSLKLDFHLNSQRVLQ
jgi:hypothetical protein